MYSAHNLSVSHGALRFEQEWCFRLQISWILLWSNVTLQCGDILIPRSWGGLRVPSREQLSSDVLHEWLVLHPSHSEQTQHVKGTIHPKMDERRYLKDFSNGLCQNNKILIWNYMFWTNYPFNGQVFHIHSFQYVAEKQQNVKAIQKKQNSAKMWFKILFLPFITKSFVCLSVNSWSISDLCFTKARWSK